MLDMEYPKAKYGRSHQEARKVICCSCSRKVECSKKSGTIQLVSERYVNLIRQHIWGEYSPDNESYPTALCDTCRLALVVLEKVCLYYLLFV